MQPVEVAAKIRSPAKLPKPGAFDYAGLSANQHIYWTGSVSGSAACGSCPAAAVRGRCLALRASHLGACPADRSVSGRSPRAALLQATLIGHTTSVERRWTNDFRVTSTYHAIVISGLHISVLAITSAVDFSSASVQTSSRAVSAAAACGYTRSSQASTHRRFEPRPDSPCSWPQVTASEKHVL